MRDLHGNVNTVIHRDVKEFEWSKETYLGFILMNKWWHFTDDALHNLPSFVEVPVQVSSKEPCQGLGTIVYHLPLYLTSLCGPGVCLLYFHSQRTQIVCSLKYVQLHNTGLQATALTIVQILVQKHYLFHYIIYHCLFKCEFYIQICFH